MPETGENKEIKKDIQEQIPSQNQDKEDVNFLIQEKCKETGLNGEKTNKVQNFFNNIDKSLTEAHKETFRNYIKNLNKNDFIKISFLNESKLNQESEKIKKNIIELIDKSAKEPLIQTYNNVNQEKTNVNQEKTNVNQEKTNVNQEKTIDKERNQLLQEVKSNYDKLLKEKPNLKPTQTQIDQQKKDLDQNGTLNQLKQKGLSEDQINNYVTFNYTYTHHQDELKDTEFGKSYENLQNSLFPKDRSINVFTGKTAISETNTLIENEPALNKYRNDIDIGNTPSNKQYEAKREKFTKLENPDEINKQYEDKENQILIKKYIKLLSKQPEEDKNKSKEQNEQQLLQRKKNTIIQANDLAQQSKNILQNRILGSAISGLAGYFDFSTTQKESVGDDFKIKDGFDIDQNIFSLKGNINGKEIEMNYNLLDGNLSIEDYLFQEKDQNVMRIGKNKFQDLKIKLPSIAMLKNQALDIGEKEVGGDNPKEYLEGLEQNLHQKLTSNFRGNQEIVKIRLERNVQKNLAVQETFKSFNNIINPDGKDIFSNKEFGKETTNRDLFKLIKLVDNSLEKYSISEIEQLRQSLPKLTDFIKNKMEKKSFGNIIKDTFNKMFSKENNETPEELEEKRTKNLYKIIRNISKKENGIRTINIEDLVKVTNELEKADPEPKNMSVQFAENIVSKPEDEKSLKELKDQLETV